MAFLSGVSMARRSRGGRTARCERMESNEKTEVMPEAQTAQKPVDIMELRSRIEARVRAEGVQLDDLFNPAKVLDLEVKLELQGDSLPEEEVQNIRNVLVEEKRSVMKAGLKNVFLVQGWGSALIGGLMASDHVPFFPDLPLGARVLGFWLVWLFAIPALRARKPVKWEKSALNIAFLGIVLVNISSPFVTKDPTLIWFANMFVMGGCYGYYYLNATKDGSAVPSPQIKGVLRWIDWGSWK